MIDSIGEMLKSAESPGRQKPQSYGTPDQTITTNKYM